MKKINFRVKKSFSCQSRFRVKKSFSCQSHFRVKKLFSCQSRFRIKNSFSRQIYFRVKNQFPVKNPFLVEKSRSFRMKDVFLLYSRIKLPFKIVLSKITKIQVRIERCTLPFTFFCRSNSKEPEIEKHLRKRLTFDFETPIFLT